MNLTEVRASRFGKGLFAVKKIPAHSVTCKATGIRLDFNETLRLAERESHCLQIGADQYMYCQPPFLYSNHSCEPNCGVNADLELFTLREILPGEELFGIILHPCLKGIGPCSATAGVRSAAMLSRILIYCLFTCKKNI
jgi:hypothetical protein